MTEGPVTHESDEGDQTSDDVLLDGRLIIRQPRKGYRAGIDALLLAATCPAKPGQRVFEPGCGVGTAALALLSRVEGVLLEGLEREVLAQELSLHNAAANGLSDRFTLHCGEVGAPPASLKPDSFDHVIVNPPFYQAGRYNPRGNDRKRQAHAEDETSLLDWVVLCRRMIRGRGSLTMINRMDRLPDCLSALSNGFGQFRLLPLWPKPGREAKLMIVMARKNTGPSFTCLPGLILHDQDGGWSEQMQRILEGEALELG
ncbi:MAG: tRNA1(Val) (adenine(37)-N6)-methyltransferase [Alphaproteobacteria bacterium]